MHFLLFFVFVIHVFVSVGFTVTMSLFCRVVIQGCTETGSSATVGLKGARYFAR